MECLLRVTVPVFTFCSWSAVNVARFLVVANGFPDPSSAHLVQLMLPLAGFYMATSNFVAVHSRFEYGLVHHAFCAAIQALLKVRVPGKVIPSIRRAARREGRGGRGWDEVASVLFLVSTRVYRDAVIEVGRSTSSCWRNSRRNKGVRVSPCNACFITCSRLYIR